MTDKEEQVAMTDREEQEQQLLRSIIEPIMSDVGDLIFYKKHGLSITDGHMCVGTATIKDDRPLCVWIDDDAILHIEIGVTFTPGKSRPGIGPNAPEHFRMQEEWYPSELRRKFYLSDPDSIEKAQQKLTCWVLNG